MGIEQIALGNSEFCFRAVQAAWVTLWGAASVGAGNARL